MKWNFRLFKELESSFKKGFCGDPRDGWYQGQIGFLEHYILPLVHRSKIYFVKEFGDALVENVLANVQVWTKHGAKATEMMVAAVDEGEEESSVLMRLYELPTL